jgi:hypothetical protein
VRVMPVRRLVLHVRHRDRDPSLPFLRRVVDRIECPKLHLRIVLREHFGDCGRQRRLAVVNVADRPHVHVRLTALEFLLCHRVYPL